MRIRMLAAALLLMCGSLGARGDDAQPLAAPESAPMARPQAQSSTPKQSLERAPADSSMEKASDQTAGRFSFYRVDGGFLRFDTQTGQIAFCNSHDRGWACEAVPENRAALEKQVDRLQAEIGELKQQLKAQEEPPRPPRPIPAPQAAPPQAAPPQVAPPAPAPSTGSGDMTSLPAREQISRAAEALQDAWHRFVALVIGVKNDVLRRS